MRTWFGARGSSAAVVSVVVLTLLASANGAGAQADDPYGPTSTTAPPEETEVSCSVDESTVVQGGVLSGIVSGVEVGTTLEFFLGGELLGEIEVPPAPQGFRALPVAPTTDVTFSFAVPTTIVPGRYEPIVVGATFTAQCSLSGGVAVLADEAVLGEGIVREADTGPGAVEVLARDAAAASGGSGALPLTGMELGVLALVGLASVVVGYALVRRRHATAG
jgi:hypothetical protein